MRHGIAGNDLAGRARPSCLPTRTAPACLRGTLLASTSVALGWGVSTGGVRLTRPRRAGLAPQPLAKRQHRRQPLPAHFDCLAVSQSEAFDNGLALLRAAAPMHRVSGAILIVPSTTTTLRMSRPPGTALVDARKGSWLWRRRSTRRSPPCRRSWALPTALAHFIPFQPECVSDGKEPPRLFMRWPRGHDGRAPPTASARGGNPFYIGRELLISAPPLPERIRIVATPCSAAAPNLHLRNAYTVHPLHWAQLRNLGAAPLPQARENSICQSSRTLSYRGESVSLSPRCGNQSNQLAGATCCARG